MYTPSADRRIISTMLENLTLAGIDVAGACEAKGLRDPRQTTEKRIPISLLSPLYDAIGEHSGDPEYVYRAIPSYNPEHLGTLFYLAKFCQTALDAYRVFCRFSALVSDAVSFNIVEGKDYWQTEVLPNRDVYISPYQIEATVYALVRIHHILIPHGKQLPIEGVYFTHGPRFDENDYRGYYGCSVYFEQPFAGARLNKAAMATPLSFADARMEAYFRTLAERHEVDMCADNSLVRTVQRLYIQRMSIGEPDRAGIAKALSLSVRTLQRKLEAEGRSYREVIEEARFAIAKQELISSDRSLEDVALLLGYSDARAFRRAFQRWTGMTPSEYRTP